MTWEQPLPGRDLVGPQRCDLVFYSQFLPFEFMDTRVIASRMLQLGQDGRVELLVAFTQFLDA